MSWVCEGCGNRNRFYSNRGVVINSDGEIIDESEEYNDEVYCSSCSEEATWLEGNEYDIFIAEHEDESDYADESPQRNMKVDVDKKLSEA